MTPSQLLKKAVLPVLGVLCYSCSEDIDTSARYVFTEETIASYLEKRPQYSQYVQLMKQVQVSPRSATTVFQLMSARGNYTCFAPNNEAVDAYLDSLCAREIISAPSWDAFPDSVTLDSIRKVIVHNSIMDGGDIDYSGKRVFFETYDFPTNNNEEFATNTMGDRKLTINYSETNPDSMWINNEALISLKNRDIPASNGVIHEVESVIAPANNTLGDLLKSFIDENREGFLVAAKMIQACGLFDTLSKVRDERYEMMYLDGKLENLKNHPTEGNIGYLPEHRKYGYTLFAEPDAFWQEAIQKPAADITPADITAYLQSQNVYPGSKADDNYKSPDNLLYQFVTYHLIPFRLSPDKIIIHYNEKGYSLEKKTPTVAMTELYTTMGKRRLLKIFESRQSEGVYLNRFPVLNNERNGNYQEKYCDPDKVGLFVDKDNANMTAINAVIYPISGLLHYSDEVRTNLQRQRLRFDVAGIFPEFINNDLRGQTVTTPQHMTVGIPSDNVYKYLDDLSISDLTLFYYLMGRGKGWPNYLADELNVIGRYEMILRLPPVPKKGTYELRIANSCGCNYRGMAQVYWGDDINNLPVTGTPFDFRLNGIERITPIGSFPSGVGWEADVDDDEDYNAEVDKKMRNNGFMKAPEHYAAGLPGTTKTARDNYYKTRRIMVTATMDPDKTYYLKFKNVMDDETKQFYMDYFEFCPKEVYDNPETPEDIW
ncbi:MAG: fasciclin domain-containing protein [Bacteroidaceae bacterium]|nr:fasciclin domain-containing protein [Bacteroidaceae bacterium]